MRDLLKLLADGNRCVSESTAPYVILLQRLPPRIKPKLGLLARVVKPAYCVPELILLFWQVPYNLIVHRLIKSHWELADNTRVLHDCKLIGGHSMQARFHKKDYQMIKNHKNKLVFHYFTKFVTLIMLLEYLYPADIAIIDYVLR